MVGMCEQVINYNVYKDHHLTEDSSQSVPFSIQANQTNYSQYIKTNLGNQLIVITKVSYILLQSN